LLRRLRHTDCRLLPLVLLLLSTTSRLSLPLLPTTRPSSRPRRKLLTIRRRSRRE
jgi:hypothetical protein